MQFLLIAYDGTDGRAMERRLAARPEHLRMGKELHETGKWLYAAGILDDEGKMIGSMIVCDFLSREEMDRRWLSREPYITAKVWQKIDIQRVQVAPFCTAKKET